MPRSLKKLLFFLAFFFSFTSTTWAISCTEIEKSIARERTNIELEQFIQNQNQKFAQAYSQTLAQAGDCSKKDQIDNLWKNLKSNHFGLENFLFSASSLYENSCRQKDIEKLLTQIDAFDRTIVETIQECKDPESMTKIIDTSIQMMKFIRDHDENKTDMPLPGSNQETFGKYWDEEFYSQGSHICPTESWAEVKKAWCQLSNSLQNFSFLGKNLEQTPEQAKASEESRRKLAQEEALKWLQLNLPDFLHIQSRETSAEKSSKHDSFLGVVFAPVLNSFDALFSSNEGRSPQALISGIENQSMNTVKLFEVNDLLSEISDKYGKSYEAQVYLEKQIHAIRLSAERLESPAIQRNLRDFLLTLKKTENHAPNQCSITIK